MCRFGYILGFILTAAVYEAQGNVCDVNEVETCKHELMLFESGNFPFYGGDEIDLDRTCKTMNETFDCIDDFVNNCEEKPECDKDCQPVAEEISTMWRHSGVPALHDQLCSIDHPLRDAYLHHYTCFLKAEHLYDKCQNISYESQEYMKTLSDEPSKQREASCCFLSWYQDCYQNATMEICGPNATFVVSFAIHLLTGHIVSQMCDSRITCENAPLDDDFTKYFPAETTSTDSMITTNTDVYINNFESGIGTIQCSVTIVTILGTCMLLLNFLKIY